MPCVTVGRSRLFRYSAENQNGEVISNSEDEGEAVLPIEKKEIFEHGYGKNRGMGLFLAREVLAITNSTNTGTFQFVTKGCKRPKPGRPTIQG